MSSYNFSNKNIASEYNENSEDILNIIIDVTSGVTVFTSCFIVYLIIFKSPPIMSTYRKYLLVNVLLEMLVVIILSLGKPKVLYGLFLAFSTGLLPIQSPVVTRLACVLWGNALTWSSTSSTLIHVERYFTLHQEWKTKNRFIGPKFFIWFYLVLNILVTTGILSSGIFGDIYIDGPVVSDYVRNIDGGRELLQKYPGTVLFNNKRSMWTTIYNISLLIASIFILVPLFIFLFLNAFSGFKAINSNNYSPKTKKVHTTLLWASICQALLLLLSAFIPIIFLVGSLVAGKTIVEMGYTACILNLNPLSNNIITIFFVKPYRDFIFSYWKKNSVKEYSGKT